MMITVRRPRVLVLGVLTLIGVLAAAACGSGISEEDLEAKDQEIATLQTQVAESQDRVQALEQDAKFWTQLTEFLPPVEMPSMTDHRAYMLPSGMVVALHFDNMNLDNAENLNWVAVGIPGTFCSSEQERVEAELGEGFTHFHDMENDIHGGEPGAKGVWFVHMGVRDFESPMSEGPVQPGIDHGFMPTPPPDCA